MIWLELTLGVKTIGTQLEKKNVLEILEKFLCTMNKNEFITSFK
jgi:hypothetical protein